MKIEEIFLLRKDEPEKFWKELSNCLLKEVQSNEFFNILSELSKEVYCSFLFKKKTKSLFPYHIAYYVQDDSLQFRYFVQMTAQNDAEISCPMPIITGILPFPSEQCYVFHLHDNGYGQNEVDIFCPHMVDRYARRAYCLPNDLPMPSTWHKTKRKPNEVDFKDKEVEKLFKLVGKFFARNKINRLCYDKRALSRNEQEISSDDIACLWMDGMTACTPYCNGTIWLHKTFIPYWKDTTTKDDTSIGEDQLNVIAPYLKELFEQASSYFPEQYGSYSFITQSGH